MVDKGENQGITKVSLGYICWTPFISVTNCVLIHLVDVEIFHQTSEDTDLLMALEEKSGDHQTHSGDSSRDHASLYKLS